MQKKTMVIGNRRYRLDEKEAGAVRLVREAYRLKCEADGKRTLYDIKRKELIKLMTERLRGKKSVEIDAVDVKARLELQSKREYDQDKLAIIAREYGAEFWKVFEPCMIYVPRDELKLLLRGKLPEKKEALVGEIRMAEVVKEMSPKLRFLEPAE